MLTHDSPGVCGVALMIIVHRTLGHFVAKMSKLLSER
jgi:hypothetical protein